MKFWLLMSIMRNEVRTLRSVATQNSSWKFVVEWIDGYSEIVKNRERSKLDHMLPIEFVRQALRQSKLKFYLTRDRVLRSKRASFFDKSIAALEAFDLFGAEVMEEVLEFGSKQV